MQTKSMSRYGPLSTAATLLVLAACTSETTSLLFVAPAVHAFVAPSTTAPAVRLAPVHIAPITVAALDDAVTAKVISAELQEMLDREWIEQDCHRVLGRRARGARGARGLRGR